MRRIHDGSDVAIKILHGYHSVTLRLTPEQQRLEGRGVVAVTIGVHILVAHCFIEGHDIGGRIIVDHIDSIRNDNHFTNLRWATIQQNAAVARGIQVRITAVDLDESITANSISALNQQGFFNIIITRRHFVDGQYRRQGVWNNQEGIQLLCELIDP